jgi:hypothetical protein
MEDMNALKMAWDVVANVGDAVFGNILVPAVGSAIGGAVVTSMAWRKLLGGHDRAINISATYYVPSGIPNPVTGEEFIDQEITTIDNDFNFVEAFRGPGGKSLARLVEKATNMTNAHTVLGFSFLEDLIPEEELEEITEVISAKWKGYFSSLLGDKEVYSLTGGTRERIEEKTILVVPVFEGDKSSGSRKILLIPPKYLQEGGLPKLANLRVNIGKDESGATIYRHVDNHPANQRLITLQNVRAEIGAADQRAKWLTNFAPSIKTGRVISVPDPFGPSN